jgi:hypothetical protein
MKTFGIGKIWYMLFVIFKNCTVHCTMYTVQCTLYNVQCTMYNVQCTMYIQCTLIQPMGDIAKQWLKRIQYVFAPKKRWIN